MSSQGLRAWAQQLKEQMPPEARKILDRYEAAHNDLTARYISHVTACEGVDFLDDQWRYYYRVQKQTDFTDGEWAELRRLSGRTEEDSAHV